MIRVLALLLVVGCASPPVDVRPVHKLGLSAAPAWDWYGVVGTGQSLSVGAPGGAFNLPGPSAHGLQISLGSYNPSTLPYDPTNVNISVVALGEPMRSTVITCTGWPSNIWGETQHSAMAAQLAVLRSGLTSAHTEVAEACQPISVINKAATWTNTNGHAYPATIFDVSAFTRLAGVAGKKYGVGAIVLTHGESDATSVTYESDMRKLWSDYNQDIPAITGQTVSIPILLSQQQTSPADGYSAPDAIALQLHACNIYPGDLVCIGPKYQYPYADLLHLTPTGYDMLGEKTAEVYYQRVILGNSWTPLQPISVSRSTNVITVSFVVPTPPMQWDATLPLPHQSVNTAWASGKGFEVANSAGEQTISSVAIAGNTVQITLSGTPNTSCLVVRYAYTQDGTGYQGGTATGRIGQLADSDPLVGASTGLSLKNYAMSFQMPVN